jgi:hypothetical protein
MSGVSGRQVGFTGVKKPGMNVSLTLSPTHHKVKTLKSVQQLGFYICTEDNIKPQGQESNLRDDVHPVT